MKKVFLQEEMRQQMKLVKLIEQVNLWNIDTTKIFSNVTVVCMSQTRSTITHKIFETNSSFRVK